VCVVRSGENSGTDGTITMPRSTTIYPRWRPSRTMDTRSPVDTFTFTPFTSSGNAAPVRRWQNAEHSAIAAANFQCSVPLGFVEHGRKISSRLRITVGLHRLLASSTSSFNSRARSLNPPSTGGQSRGDGDPSGRKNLGPQDDKVCVVRSGARKVDTFSSIHFDLLAFVDERRHLHDQASFGSCGFGYARCGRALEAGFGLDHG
jgi:hypothetical protein